MATLGEFFQLMRHEVPDRGFDPIAAQQWLQQRYAEVLERAPWAFLIKEATFTTTAEITAGTVTVTLGSTTVTESVSNANGWSSAVQNRYFRAGGETEFYLISTFTDANPDTLTLNRNYEGATTTLAGYKVIQRFYSLASDVREVISMAAINPIIEMEKISQQDLDIAFPNRGRVDSPEFWAPAGLDSSNVYQVELYPIPDKARGILYHYIQQTPSVADGDAAIFPQVSYGLLRSGFLADYWNWLSAKADAPEGALNQANRFEQEFEKRVIELIIREAANTPPRRMRFSSRIFRHQKESKIRLVRDTSE